MHLGGAFDYTSNVCKPTWPDGLDVEVVRFEALADAWREASRPADREHVTRFIRNHPEQYSQGDLTGAPDLSALRWTVDEPEDLELVRFIYQALYPGNPAFTTGDILSLLEGEPKMAKAKPNE